MSDINILAPLCLFRLHMESKRKIHMKLDLPLTKDTEHAIHLQVGQNLQVIREYRGMSRREIAAMLNVSYQQVQKYETASNRLSVGKVIVLSHILNVPISEFTRTAINPIFSVSDPAQHHLMGVKNFMNRDIMLGT